MINSIEEFKKLFFLMGMIALPILSLSQQYYAENITIRDGLPSNSVRDIFKDSKGVMWFGTDGGLVRYDGKEFKTYNERDGLAGNKIWSIDEDNKGNLCLGLWGAGIAVFDGETFRNYTKDDGLSDNWTRRVHYSHDFNCIVVGTHHGLSVVKDSVVYKLIGTSDDDTLSNSKEIVTTQIIDSDSAIFVYAYNGNHQLIKFRNGKPYLSKFPYPELKSYKISSAYHSKNGDKYYGWERKGILHQSVSEQMKKYDSIGQVFSFSEEKNGDVWVAAWNGDYGGGLYKFKNNKAISYNSKISTTSVLGFSSYYDTIQNILWYGTLDQGLYKVPEPKFTYYTPQENSMDKLDVIDVTFDKNNKKWFITKNALFQETVPGEFKKYDRKIFIDLLDKKKIDSILYFETQFELSTIKYIDDSTLFLSIKKGGLFRLKIKKNNIIDIKFLHPDISDFNTNKNEYIYSQGYWKQNLKKYNYENDTVWLKNEYHYLQRRIYATKSFHYNIPFFLSRLEGVYFIENDSLCLLNQKIPSLSMIVNDMCFDQQYAYLGGNNGIIEVISTDEKKKIAEFSIPDKHQPVKWMEKVGYHLFVGYAGSLAIYDATNLDILLKKEPVVFSESEGYNTGNIYTSVVDLKNQIWLASEVGLVSFDPEALISSKKYSLNTVLTDIRINNQPINWMRHALSMRWGIIENAKDLKFNYWQNNLRIDFQTLNYLSQEDDIFHHYLKGIDHENQNPRKVESNHVDYFNLPPGEYEFVVFSRNRHTGIESEKASLNFMILTPWFKSWWFYTLIFLLLTFILIYIWNYRIALLKRKENEKRIIASKIALLETKALQAQMNPHFIFNSLNSIQTYILNDETDKALQYLSDFSKLVRTTLDYINKKQITIDEEITYLENYIKLEKARFRLDLKSEFIVSDELDQEIDKIPPMLLQPLVENSIKHGFITTTRNKRIKIEFKLTPNGNLQCSVEDNGIGRSASNNLKSSNKIVAKESLGLKIIEERIKNHNKDDMNFKALIIKDLYNKDGGPAGTRIELFIRRKEDGEDFQTS